MTIARTGRTGLVLGGGGLLGAAWTMGALAALERETGWDPRTADVILGTSAGSVVAALLGFGASTADMCDHVLGRPVTSGPLAGHAFDYDHAISAKPPVPRFGIGSRRLAVRGFRHPREFPPLSIISAFLPLGRGSLDVIAQLVSAVSPAGWSPHPGVRVVAMDYDTGERAVFGAAGAPQASLTDAVVASCSVPGWFPPKVIDGHRYVDGGMRSDNSVDLLAATVSPDGPFDEVWVFAPGSARQLDRPTTLSGRLERRLRRYASRTLLGELRVVRGSGTRVRGVIAPGAEDLRVMGANLMDPSRRREVLEMALRTVAADIRARPQFSAA
jgi:NTE family protein